MLSSDISGYESKISQGEREEEGDWEGGKKVSKRKAS